MVHVGRCPNKEGRGNPTTEFYIDGKPQIYCYGWEYKTSGEPLECCKKCPDWVRGEQCEKDFKKAYEEGRTNK